MTSLERLSSLDAAAGYAVRDGVLSRENVTHDEETYDSRGFSVLLDMQRRHFWQVGRQRVLQGAIERTLPGPLRSGRAVIDLGGGCGGWVAHLNETGLFPAAELALGDSSLNALRFAKGAQSADVALYQINLMDLGWKERWDVTFMLDVLEHIPDHLTALSQVRDALKPGGTCIVTVPALQAFWSYNDDVVGHQRRYSQAELVTLAEQVGLEVIDSRYFMFALSPVLWASRLLTSRNVDSLTSDQKWEIIERTHRVPVGPVNQLLASVLKLEAAGTKHLRYPWGTSLLGVFRRPL